MVKIVIRVSVTVNGKTHKLCGIYGGKKYIYRKDANVANELMF
jgi:hypothetical protein